MTLTRSIGKSVSRLLIAVLLFAQFAVASYACPKLSQMAPTADVKAVAGMPVAAAADTTATQRAAMPPGCDQSDPAAANLCAEHCRFGQQSVDTGPALVVHAALATFLYSLPLEPAYAPGSSRSIPSRDARLAAAPEPPHAILHCVFRI